ncbi:MAG: hypothetical protein RLZZ248_1182 [Bacteroidota bacterium]
MVISIKTDTMRNFMIPIALLFLFTRANVTVASNTYACAENFIVPLNEECKGELTLDMVLIGEDVSQFTSLVGNGKVVVSSSELPGKLLSVSDEDAVFFGENSTWMYGVYVEQGDGTWDLFCWNFFRSEDKIDPAFVGWKTPASEIQAFESYDPRDSAVFMQYGTYKMVEYATWDDSLDAGSSDAVFYPQQWSCWQSSNHPDSSFTWPNSLAKEYDTIRFTASSDGVLTLFASSYLNTGSSEPGFDPVLAVYGKGGFDSDNPCHNLLAFGESTFIPNPLAGLGFLNLNSTGSLPGTGTDSGDVFAPWLLHDNPIVRMDVKISVGQEYTLLMSHRGSYSGNGKYQVHLLLNDYSSGVNQSVVHHLSASDSLGVDTSYSYFDFLCGDLATVRLNQQVKLNQNQYLGGSLSEMGTYLGTDSVKAKLDSAWYATAATLLSQQGIRDTSFIDLDHFNISKELMDTMLYHYGFMPMVIENCNEWEVVINDQYEGLNECGLEVGGFNGFTEGKNISGILTRTYIVNDLKDKTDPDTARVQLIFRNPTLYDVRLPHYSVNLECDQLGGEIAVLPNGHPSPVSTGYPFVATMTGFVDLTKNSAYCNLAASYEDAAEITNCSNNISFRREWTIYDWCRPGTTTVYHQVIKIGDFTAPIITATSLQTTPSFSPNECSGSVSITRGLATDLCGDVRMSVKLFTNTGEELAFYPLETVYEDGQAVTNANLLVKNLVQGEYRVEWTSIDQCGNKSIENRTFTITDNISPSCVIDNLRNISLTNYGETPENGDTIAFDLRGEAYIPAARLNEGSEDNCYPVEVLVRREKSGIPTPWSDLVQFNCSDAGDSVKVEMMARALVQPGVYGDSTICWTYIFVENKTIPVCRDLPTVEYFCEDVPSGDLAPTSDEWDVFFAKTKLEQEVVVSGLCVTPVRDIRTEVVMAQCGYGYVTRYYEVYNDSGLKYLSDTCRATIVFEEKHEYAITLPADTSIVCSAEASPQIKYDENACDLVVISSIDERFSATADECYKIFKKIKMINWCEYDGVSAPIVLQRQDVNNDGQKGDSYSVMVSGNVNYENYVVTTYRPLMSSVQDTLDGHPDNNQAVRSWWNPLVWASEDDAKSVEISNPKGYFEYTQVIKVFDNNAPEITLLTSNTNFESFSNDLTDGCAAPVTILATIDDACTMDSSQLLVIEVLLDQDADNLGSIIDRGENFDYSTAEGTDLYTVGYDTALITIQSEGIPVGEHLFRIVASDGCGNTQFLDVPFAVEDKKGPAPICIDGFAVELMPDENGDGIATVEAVDFVVTKPIFDCSGDTENYNILLLPAPTGGVLVNATDSSLTLTCDNIENLGPDTLDVAIVATDGAGNRDYCITTIVLQDNQGLCINENGLAGLITTEENHAVKGVTIKVSGAGSTEDMEPVVTDDRGVYEVDDLKVGGDYTIVPEKQGSIIDGISTLDIIYVTKHILGVQKFDSPYKVLAADVNASGTITTLDVILLRKLILGVTSSISNNKTWHFIPLINQFDTPESILINRDQIKEFININNVTTDMVNQDFVAVKTGDVNYSAGLDIKPRGNQMFKLKTDNIWVNAGKTYQVKFSGKDPDIEGYQFAFKLNAGKLINVVEGIAQKEHFGLKYAEEGIVLTSWNGFGVEGTLFGLEFTAEKSGYLSDMIQLLDEYLQPEAYNKEGDLLQVALDFENALPLPEEFELFQNAPNPFRVSSTIKFSIPETSQVTITITDVTGKTIRRMEGNYDRGWHQLEVNQKLLSGPGMYYYSIQSGKFSQTRKMVLLQ